MNRSRQWVELLAKMYPAGEPVPYPPQFLLERGREFAERVASPWRGTPRACFVNARYLAARRRLRLRYSEGYAVSVIPVAHAWCVDEAGRVVDPTWSEEYAPDYFGVVLDLATVRRATRGTGCFSVFDIPWRWDKIYPLLAAATAPAGAHPAAQDATKGGRRI